MPDAAVSAFLESLTAEDGVPGLSEAKVHRLDGEAAETVAIVEGDEVVAVGVAAPHGADEATVHWSVETAVAPGLRFADFEGSVVDAVLANLPDGATGVSVWSARATLDAALDRRGFRPTRRLLHMVVDLPIPSGGEPAARVRPIEPDEVDTLLRINRRAFADHREAASLDRSEFEELAGKPWFDPGGILVSADASGVTGFCWTKVHPNGDGEIYRIAVDPDRHGRGLGRTLVVAGFGHLAERGDVTRGTLWVDADNASAVGLYESIGMRTERVNTEFERAQPKR